ncbi:heme ABC transporter ATP-binding protein [Kaistia geumhonensis]|uniref:Iron complex transport system ATP-binding protein n=1 Tax=Kaistia geumhonensis TaxID=410839 RepID=A0ABU0M6P0_9HYPH|nr:heme ABC transporter ATP-binding protein [Kaistia geumhonensis]MCX5478144.1 heme ABC transporter ATP-binding protein [Kaistia geumhonensis]MDQ0516640.1 iron complex transport system ATP-binding protein [Kaistia geumhonensis]
MITAEDITIRAGGNVLIDRVSLALRPGSVTAIVGPNGAGKSTLVRALTGEIAPAAGRVAIDGEDLARLAPRALAARRAVLPQASSLAFPYTVHEVVRLGVLAARDRRAANDRVVAALSAVDLSGFGGRLYQQLSGGEQQRVHLARVLCQLPEPCPGGQAAWLFLDEPTSSLDLRHQLMALAAAQRFARAGGGVVAVLHDLNLAARHADRIVVVRKGRIAADGPPAEVLTAGLIEDVFGVALAVGLTGDGTPYVLPHGIAAAS